MNEKEALTGLKNLSQIFKLCSENDVKLKDFNIMNPKAYKEAIETILDFYNKEKEKNKELEEKCKEVVCVPEGTCFVAVPKNMISKDKLKFILSKLNISDIEPWSTYKIDGQILFDLQELL